MKILDKINLWITKKFNSKKYKKSIDYCREDAIRKCKTDGKTYHIIKVGDGYVAICNSDLGALKKKGIIKKTATMVDILKIKIETISYKNLK